LNVSVSTDTPRWHSLDPDESARRLETDSSTGLAHEVAADRLRHYGANELPVEEQLGLARIVFGQFTDFMIVILLIAAVISGVLGDLSDAAAIIVIVVLNATVGAVQEYRAQRAIAALKQMAAAEARVVRGGRSHAIAASELVPGDLVKLTAGDIVPADLRLIETDELHADESMLTGESLPVRKHTSALADGELAVGDRFNMAFKQTSVMKGAGIGLVVATGLRTEIGRIALLLAERKSLRTPLQQRLTVFGRRLALGVLAVCALIFGLGLLNGQPPLLMFLTAVSLAVAAIPEALPAVVTVALAIGARNLSRRRSLVRRLPAVESLGSVTFICADKTGTLTENRMTMARVFAGGRAVEDPGELHAALRTPLLETLALCNTIDPTGAAPGDPTENALEEAARHAGTEKSILLKRMPQIAVLNFDSERKRMTTLHARDGQAVALTKGAPEEVFACCETSLAENGNEVPFDETAAAAAVDALAGRGYRVLALARREFASLPESRDSGSLETRMTFVGLAALHDPVRSGVPQAIRECLSAGITPIMITGDHPQTARNVAVELGLADATTNVLTGREMRRLSEEELLARLRETRVCARVDPDQKIRIVETLQRSGEFVAMTGDGVNDAPALKQATIGVSMGGRGTDVAREASDMVLLDDNFATIVAAVREGRRIYDNIRKFIRYTMATNSGEVGCLVMASLIGLPLPLLPIQILWINLVTDALPGLAFSAEPAEPDIMRRPPRKPQESLFAGGIWQHMLWVGPLMSGLSLVTVVRADLADVGYWQTMVFTTLVVAQLLQALATRSESRSLLTVGLFTNPYLLATIVGTLAVQVVVLYVPPLSTVLRVAPLAPADLLLSFALGAVVLPLIEIEKAVKRRRRRRRST
jgi:P-type Ca2+ transporter type 2C